MKIGIDGRLWNETGVGRYIRNLVGELEKIDNKNSYILFVPSKVFEQLFSEGKRFQNGRWKMVPTDIKWHTLSEQIKFPQLLNNYNIDLMHFPYFSVPVFYNKPFVVTLHDLIINHFPTGRASTLPLPFYYIKLFGYRYIFNRTVKKAVKIIVPLETVKKDVLKNYECDGAKIVVTYEGVEEKFVNYHKKNISLDMEAFFLYVGNAYPHKNLDRLIDAFELFRKDHMGVKLVLAGKKDYFYNKLEERVKEEKIEGVIFKYNLSDDELFDFYSHAKALVSPSLMEGFGLPALEAVVCGSAVLLSDIPSFREVWGDSAFYFNPYDKNDIKEKLKYVYDLDKEIKQKVVAKAYARIQNFSWKRMATQTLKVYEDSIGV